MICKSVNPDSTTYVKTCTHCGETKSASEFHKDSRIKSGIRPDCKECRRNQNNARYATNPEKYRHQKRSERDQNREKLRKQRLARYAADPQKYLSAMRKCRANNLELFRARESAYAKKNRPSRNATHAVRRATKSNATPAWLTEAQKLRIKNLYADAAWISILTGIPHQVDHIHPLKGDNFTGLHVPWNLCIIPAIDNNRKRNNPPESEADMFWPYTMKQLGGRHGA